MGPASRFEIRQRDAFALALWELGHYRRRGAVRSMYEAPRLPKGFRAEFDQKGWRH